MISLYKVFMPEGLIEKLNQILYSGKLSYGENAKNFEKKLKKYIGNPLLITTSDNYYPLQISFDLININPNDEVISSPMSCLATNQPILTCKGKVVWADIDTHSGTLDPDDVRKKITKKTKAILHYHWCGYPGYIDEINQIGKEYGIFIIEDATEAFGAEYNNKKIGNNGSDFVCFSFQPVRFPNSISGGAIAFNSKDLFNKALLKRDYGIDRKKFRDELGEINPACDISLHGYNAMMNEISGYIGSIQLDYFDDLIKRQYLNASAYDKAIKNIDKLKKLGLRKNIKPSYWIYTLLSEESNKIIRYFRKRNIFASKVHQRNDIYSIFGTGLRKELKGVNYFSECEICIPCGWWITEEERNQIIDVIKLLS